MQKCRSAALQEPVSFLQTQYTAYAKRLHVLSSVELFLTES